ncbi:MAG: BrnA antitoxin family protein [Comamonadaceae bacterium]|nr:BrnA antitoxin family protein [Comamonadaceae bacterium]
MNPAAKCPRSPTRRCGRCSRPENCLPPCNANWACADRSEPPTKERITIRLSHDVVEQFRATGDGWQTRIDTALQEWLSARGHSAT